MIIMCSQGYTFSLAAASLPPAGPVHAATDLDGGYRAWAAACPVHPAAVP